MQRENDETAKNCRIIKSNELLSNYYSRRQNLRRKDIFKIYLSLYKDLVFCRFKHQVTWLKFLSETSHLLAKCSLWNEDYSHGPMKALRSIHDFFLNFVTLPWRGFYTPYVSTTLLLITAGSLHRQQWQTACYSDESFPVYIGVVCV